MTKSGQQEGAVPEDAEISGKQLERLGRRSSDNGRRVNGSRREMRPSMEARWRKLDISALQVCLIWPELSNRCSNDLAAFQFISLKSRRLGLLKPDQVELWCSHRNRSERKQAMMCRSYVAHIVYWTDHHPTESSVPLVEKLKTLKLPSKLPRCGQM